jgi:nicotinate-nucleotide pyrophosphorylase (carboxylating)
LEKEFVQVSWNADLERDLRELIRLAMREDVPEGRDWTTLALVTEHVAGRASLAARKAGIIAGLPAVPIVLAEFDGRLDWSALRQDGQAVAPGDEVGRIKGPARSLLAAERLVLNLLGRLSGVASLTSQYVQAIRGTQARIYDTRKTTPGWRRLEKYAVRCGGGRNHRTGLSDAVLIKDNHLAAITPSPQTGPRLTPGQAVTRAREYVQTRVADHSQRAMIVEVEVDTLEQLEEVLPSSPDMVLLDNMTLDELRSAVARRDRIAPAVELEASGGVSLGSVRAIAETGVDRISAGALTHAAAWLDMALDWIPVY